MNPNDINQGGNNIEDDLNVFNDVTIIREEEPTEEDMEVEEIANEPPDSRKINSCKKCRRMKFGHPVPYGQEHCQLERIDDDESLKADDETKNRKRIELRRNKKKRSLSDEKTDSVAKKKKDKEYGSDEELERMQEEERELEAKLKKTEENIKNAEKENKAKKEEQRKRNEELRKKLESKKDK